MENKNSFSITLAGKSYRLTGDEPNEYLKSIGEYIEKKYADYSTKLFFRSQPADMQHILMQLNIADDYFKCREKLVNSMRVIDEQAEEIKRLKDSLVSLQVRYENLESGTKHLEKKYQEAKAKISRRDNEQKI